MRAVAACMRAAAVCMRAALTDTGAPLHTCGAAAAACAWRCCCPASWPSCASPRRATATCRCGAPVPHGVCAHALPQPGGVGERRPCPDVRALRRKDADGPSSTAMPATQSAAQWRAALARGSGLACEWHHAAPNTLPRVDAGDPPVRAPPGPHSSKHGGRRLERRRHVRCGARARLCPAGRVGVRVAAVHAAGVCWAHAAHPSPCRPRATRAPAPRHSPAAQAATPSACSRTTGSCPSLRARAPRSAASSPTSSSPGRSATGG